MTIDFVPEHHKETKPRITVFGVGGAGGNAVNNMINGQLEGVEFVVANTDSQSLVQSLAERRLGLPGRNGCRGVAAGLPQKLSPISPGPAIGSSRGRSFRGLAGEGPLCVVAWPRTRPGPRS